RQSNRGEQQRQATKETKKPRGQAFLRQRLLRACGLRADFSDRQITVQLLHHLAHGGGQRRWFAGRAHRKVHRSNCVLFLTPRRIKQRLDLFTLTHVFRVADYANNLNVSIAEKNRDVLSQDVFVRKKFADECLTDDADLRSMLVILRSETASAQQRDFHRGKIVFAGYLPVNVMFGGGLFLFTRQQNVG